MKFIKNNIKLFVAIIITMVVTASITGVVAYNYNAKDIDYTPKDTSWKVDNVEDAIKDLKEISKNYDVIYDSMMEQRTSSLNTSISTTFAKDYSFIFIVYGTINTGGICPPTVNTNLQLTQLKHFEASTYGKIYMTLSLASNVKNGDYITIPGQYNCAGPFMFIIGINEN